MKRQPPRAASRALLLAATLAAAGGAGCGSEPRGHFEKLHVGRLHAFFKRGTVTTSTDGTDFNSRESATNRPELVITTLPP